jgi:hypothetical protein
MDSKERLGGYRCYVYEVGAYIRYDGLSSITIDVKILDRKHKTGFDIIRLNRFRYHAC